MDGGAIANPDDILNQREFSGWPI